MPVLIFTLADAAPSDGGSVWGILPFLVIMFALMYFLLIRPANKKEKERLNMLSKIEKNDRVLTTGGIYGIITNIKENEVTLKIDDESNVKVRLARNAIVGVLKDDKTENKM